MHAGHRRTCESSWTPANSCAAPTTDASTPPPWPTSPPISKTSPSACTKSRTDPPLLGAHLHAPRGPVGQDAVGQDSLSLGASAAAANYAGRHEHNPGTRTHLHPPAPRAGGS